MTDLTRDSLADALMAVKTEAAAHGDVRVDLANIAGSIQTLTTEVRLGREADQRRQNEQAAELEHVKTRVASLERQFWKIAGTVGLFGAVAGSAGSYFLG